MSQLHNKLRETGASKTPKKKKECDTLTASRATGRGARNTLAVTRTEREGRGGRGRNLQTENGGYAWRQGVQREDNTVARCCGANAPLEVER